MGDARDRPDGWAVRREGPCPVRRRAPRPVDRGGLPPGDHLAVGRPRLGRRVAPGLVGRTCEEPRRTLRVPVVSLVALLAIVVALPNVRAEAWHAPSSNKAAVFDDEPLPLLGYSSPDTYDPDLLADLGTVVDDLGGRDGGFFDFTNGLGWFHYLLGLDPLTSYYHVSMAVPEFSQEDLVSQLRGAPAGAGRLRRPDRPALVGRRGQPDPALRREPVPAGRVDPGAADARGRLHAAQRPARGRALDPCAHRGAPDDRPVLLVARLQLGLRAQLPRGSRRGSLGRCRGRSGTAGSAGGRRGAGPSTRPLGACRPVSSSPWATRSWRPRRSASRDRTWRLPWTCRWPRRAGSASRCWRRAARGSGCTPSTRTGWPTR